LVRTKKILNQTNSSNLNFSSVKYSDAHISIRAVRKKTPVLGISVTDLQGQINGGFARTESNSTEARGTDWKECRPIFIHRKKEMSACICITSAPQNPGDMKMTSPYQITSSFSELVIFSLKWKLASPDTENDETIIFLQSNQSSNEFSMSNQSSNEFSMFFCYMVYVHVMKKPAGNFLCLPLKMACNLKYIRSFILSRSDL
jgi:hypothetical protein